MVNVNLYQILLTTMVLTSRVKNLIKSIVAKDKEEQEGTDEATLCLVQQLQKDCENEVKQEEPEPFKYDEDDFPPLTK